MLRSSTERNGFTSSYNSRSHSNTEGSQVRNRRLGSEGRNWSRGRREMRLPHCSAFLIRHRTACPRVGVHNGQGPHPISPVKKTLHTSVHRPVWWGGPFSQLCPVEDMGVYRGPLAASPRGSQVPQPLSVRPGLKQQWSLCHMEGIEVSKWAHHACTDQACVRTLSPICHACQNQRGRLRAFQGPSVGLELWLSWQSCLLYTKT